jgi:hypothetical protein
MKRWGTSKITITFDGDLWNIARDDGSVIGSGGTLDGAYHDAGRTVAYITRHAQEV